MAKLNRMQIQGLATLVSNIQIPNFFKAKIYTGRLKSICVPGLNCYSCPGAIGSCPVGAFQAVAGTGRHKFSFYVMGSLLAFSLVFARFICGFLCPFGFFQDLVHKIPSKKLSTKKLGPLKIIKYLIMVLVVWLVVSYVGYSQGISSPYFCKYVCPQGILQGAIPLSLVDPNIRSALGSLFNLKLLILLITIGLSIVFYRPFCKFICPLGAFYALFNKVSFYQYHFDKNTCISCNKCAKICPMDVDIRQDTGHRECIRCARCKEICPTKAITSGFEGLNTSNKKEVTR